MLTWKQVSALERQYPPAYALLQSLPPTEGNVWYVDSVAGSDGNTGKAFKSAFKTIAYAVTKAAANDTIAISGSFSEAVTCSTAGVKFVGLGTGPKRAIWTAPTVAASFCLKPSANYIEVDNIYFKPVVYTTSGVPSAIRLSGSNWLQVRNCRFQGQTGSYSAIYSPVCDSDNVHITNCEFFYMNTATYGGGILGVEAGGLSYSGWVIKGCIFHSCVTAIDINGRCCVLMDNVINEYGINASGAIAAVLTMGIDLSGTSSGCNMVTRNTLDGAYTATLYVAGASGDTWRGNYVAITSTTGAYGLSVEQPA